MKTYFFKKIKSKDLKLKKIEKNENFATSELTNC